MNKSGMNGTHRRNGRSSAAASCGTGMMQILLMFALFGILCLYGGFFVGVWYTAANAHHHHNQLSAGSSSLETGISEAEVQRRVNQEVSKANQLTNSVPESEVQRRIQEEVSKATKNLEEKLRKQQRETAVATEDTASRFPDGVKDVTTGIGRIDRNEFAKTFDMGVPLDPSSDHNDEVLVFYTNQASLPKDPFVAKEAASQTTIPLLSAQEATENCDFLNVVLTDHNSQRRQCVALFGQYESFHVQKWMRLPASGKLDSSVPLRLVNRGAQSSGRKSTKSPSKEATLKYWGILSKYLQSLESVLNELRPIAEAAAVKNTVVVMVCNFGQSELLVNFICSARSRGIDLQAILVFATDKETLELAKGLGVNAFYDETNFESMPKEAAGRYADNTFTSMMLAKVYCVQMISMLGYDVLFQDVDVIWYRNPLTFFHDDTNPSQDFDAYFQDDGNHALFYAPYSANTGFYYIRNNEKTQHFFNTLLMSGDLILAARSHQIALVALLSEHASLYGLKVKIFARTENDFPGGHAFHRRKDLMKDIISGAEKPYIFHMSWTHSKDNKQKFFQQLGEWFVHDQCSGSAPDEILQKRGMANLSECCLASATVTCHYRDKPSKTPCKDSPPIDKGKPSFW